MLLSCVLWLAGDVGRDAPFLGAMLGSWLCGTGLVQGVHRLEFFPAFHEPWLGLVIDILEVVLCCAVERLGCCGTCIPRYTWSGSLGTSADDQLEAVYIYL